MKSFASNTNGYQNSARAYVPKELVLKPSKFKHIRISVTLLIFAAISATMMEKDPLIAWAGMIFCGLGGIFMLYQLFTNGSYLRLTKDGFEVRAMGKSNFTCWDDIDELFVLKTSQNGINVGETVGFNYSSKYEQNGFARSMSQAIADCEGALNDTYGMKAHDLVALMHDWKNS